MAKLELHWPLSRPCTITQGFGINGEYYRANGINIQGHNGLDLMAYHGQPVYAAHAGYAKYGVDDKNGQFVEIRSKEKADMLGFNCFYKTLYVHFCDPKKEPKYASPIP